MNPSPLNPAAFYRFSDNVIGQVLQRSRQPHLVDDGERKFSVSGEFLHYMVGSETTLPQDETEWSSNFVDQRRNNANSRGTKKKANKEFYRERNRLHQARYKKRQKERLRILETSVLQLRQETHDLKTQHRILSLTLENNKTWGVVTEYFRLFRHGYHSPTYAVGELLHPRESQVQFDFLHATMAADVVVETGCGIGALRNNWAYFSHYFHDSDMQLTCLEMSQSEETFIASSRSTVTIDKNTLRYAFPHIASDSSDMSELASKCLGKKIVVSTVSRFTWDTQKNRMTHVLYDADMMTPILQLFGSLEAVSCMFNGARITPDYKVMEPEAY